MAKICLILTLILHTFLKFSNENTCTISNGDLIDLSSVQYSFELPYLYFYLFEFNPLIHPFPIRKFYFVF